MADDMVIHEIMDNIRTLIEINGQMQCALRRMSVNLNIQAGLIADLGLTAADPLPSGPIALDSNNNNSVLPQLLSTQQWTDSQSEQVHFHCIDYPIFSYSDVGIELSDEHITTPMKLARFTEANSNLGIAKTTMADFICRNFQFRDDWLVKHFGFDPGPIFVNTPSSNSITSIFDPLATTLRESRNLFLRGKQSEFEVERNDNGVIEINTTLLTHIFAYVIKEIYNEACGMDNISWNLTNEPTSNAQMAQPQVELHENPEYKQQDLNFAPLPRFSGEYPAQWLGHTDRYFASYAIYGIDCFLYFFYCFDDEASTWFKLRRFCYILTGCSDFTESFMAGLGSRNLVTAGTAAIMPHSSPNFGNQIEVVSTGPMLVTDNSTAPIYLAQCHKHYIRLEHGLGFTTSLTTTFDIALAPNVTVLVTSSVNETEFHFVPRPVQVAKSVVYRNVKRFPPAGTIWAYPIAHIAIVVLQFQTTDQYLTWKGGTSTLIYYPTEEVSKPPQSIDTSPGFIVHVQQIPPPLLPLAADITPSQPIASNQDMTTYKNVTSQPKLPCDVHYQYLMHNLLGAWFQIDLVLRTNDGHFTKHSSFCPNFGPSQLGTIVICIQQNTWIALVSHSIFKWKQLTTKTDVHRNIFARNSCPPQRVSLPVLALNKADKWDLKKGNWDKQSLSRILMKPTIKTIIGITALLLTSAIEAFWHPKVLDLIRVSTEVYTRDQMLGLHTPNFIKLPFRLQVTAYNPVALYPLSYPHVTKIVIVQWVPNITSFAALYGHKPPNIVTFFRCNYITEDSVIRTVTTPLTCTTHQNDSLITSKYVTPDQVYSLHDGCFITMPFQFKSMLDIMRVTISNQWAPYRLVQGADFPKQSPTSDTPTNSLKIFPTLHLEDKVNLKGRSNVMNTMDPSPTNIYIITMDPIKQPSSRVNKGPTSKMDGIGYKQGKKKS